MGKIYIGQIGVKITLDTGSDLSEATTTEINYKLPDGTVGVWPGIVEGTTIYFITTSSLDLPLKGTVKLQAHAIGSDFDLLGETTSIAVTEPWK